METQSAGSVGNEDQISVHSGTVPVLSEPTTSTVEHKTAVCSSQLRPGFESVSLELIRTILENLKAPERGLMAQVCGVWKAVADEPWIWIDDHAELQAADLSTAVIDSLVRRGICRVKLASTADELRELPKLLEALPSIISLDVSGCCNLSIPVLERSFATHRFDSLTTLNLNRCQKVSDRIIHTVTIQAPNLQALHLDGCRDVRDLGIHYLSVKACEHEVALP
ncbi:hypothetical protein HPB48_016539 [Haemaphysalis longicornis]|uniref:F-box domain-containing protein n=1 Tax=Haemaphysalis longicornis TaxID=44386 RepID=A0A9J6GDJ6_HAELO|nr:hypothetical protein HPB48_016539 [Haemaphysalis longicornis]